MVNSLNSALVDPEIFNLHTFKDLYNLCNK
jgi:hypothetical protein